MYEIESIVAPMHPVDTGHATLTGRTHQHKGTTLNRQEKDTHHEIKWR